MASAVSVTPCSIHMRLHSTSPAAQSRHCVMVRSPHAGGPSVPIGRWMELMNMEPKGPPRASPTFHTPRESHPREHAKPARQPRDHSQDQDDDYNPYGTTYTHTPVHRAAKPVHAPPKEAGPPPEPWLEIPRGRFKPVHVRP